MENIINYICNGSNEFTPAVVVGLRTDRVLYGSRKHQLHSC